MRCPRTCSGQKLQPFARDDRLACCRCAESRLNRGYPEGVFPIHLWRKNHLPFLHGCATKASCRRFGWISLGNIYPKSIGGIFA